MVVTERGPKRVPPLYSASVLILLGAVLASFYHPPVVTFAPGDAFDVSKDITITGTTSGGGHGAYILTPVALSQPNMYGLVGALAQRREITTLSSVLPKGSDQDKYFADQRAEFDESRRVAAAAAARAAGLPVTI